MLSKFRFNAIAVELHSVSDQLKHIIVVILTNKMVTPGSVHKKRVISVNNRHTVLQQLIEIAISRYRRSVNLNLLDNECCVIVSELLISPKYKPFHGVVCFRGKRNIFIELDFV